MAARRGKSQARRSGGNSGGLPGWAWMVLGIVLALLAVLVLPRYFKGEGENPFFRPQPNPDARPAISAIDEDLPPPAGSRAAEPASTPAPATGQPTQPDYDFYTLLPEQEVAMTDAQLAATAREEAERQRRTAEASRQAQQTHPDAAEPARPTPLPETAQTRPAPERTASPPASSAAGTARDTARTVASATPVTDNSRYLLQAGAFKASGDAEALKARIALLGLQARVESGTANGETVYRVRLGPYGSATELAEAKQKLGNGGLPALAIKSQ